MPGLQDHDGEGRTARHGRTVRLLPDQSVRTSEEIRQDSRLLQ